MSYVIAPIVEGHGDIASVRILLNRLAPELSVARPVRYPKSRLIIAETLLQAARIAAANINHRGAVLLLLDQDEDCARELGPRLLKILSDACQHRHCAVVLPVREFEAWIVGGDERYGITNPDEAGGLKSKIAAIHGIYKESVDQPKLTSRIDIALLSGRSRSFRHFRKVVDAIIADAAI